MKLDITISNPKTKQRTNIALPARYSAIEDVLFRLDCDETISASGRILDEYGRGAVTFYFETCSIFELNHLATITQKFDHDRNSQFIGGYFLMSQKGIMDAAKTLNLAMNIQSNNLVLSQPAMDECDLAEFYLDNELIPELADVSNDIYQWIVDHTDLQKLGEEIRQKENGTFISDDYVTMEELEPLYDGNSPMPFPEPYVFKLEVGFHPDNDDGSRYSLPLPVSHSEIERMVKEMEAKDLSELTCYTMQSIVPSLEPMDFHMSEVETVNQLATSIAYFKETGELNTYKAMVDALDIIYLEAVHNVCACISEFELNSSDRDFASYGRNRFQNILPEELLECLDTEDYGRKIAEKNGVSMTEYGALVPKDGVPLMEKLAQLKELQAQTTAMEQTM